MFDIYEFNKVHIINAGNGSIVGYFTGHLWGYCSVSFSPDSKSIAIGFMDSSIGIFDFNTKKELHRLKGHTRPVCSVSFSPNGNYIASVSFDTIFIWNLETGSKICLIDDQTNYVKYICFSTNEDCLATWSSFEVIIRIWNPYTGNEIGMLEGHTNDITSVSFSPDDKYLASGSYDQTIRIWKMSSRSELYRFEGHNDIVRSVSFSPNGNCLVSGSDDKSIRIWNLEKR